MSINPYESPRTVPDVQRKGPASVPMGASVFAVVGAGLLGGSLFLASMQGLLRLGAHSIALGTAISVGSIASLLVLVAVDWNYQRQRPPIWSALTGMFLALPIALPLAVFLGLAAYDRGAERLPGGLFIALACYYSFFLTLSLGGWIAIRWARRVLPVPGK